MLCRFVKIVTGKSSAGVVGERVDEEEVSLASLLLCIMCGLAGGCGAWFLRTGDATALAV